MQSPAQLLRGELLTGSLSGESSAQRSVKAGCGLRQMRVCTCACAEGARHEITAVSLGRGLERRGEERIIFHCMSVGLPLPNHLPPAHSMCFIIFSVGGE